MEYIVDGVEGNFEGRIEANLGDGRYNISINGKTVELHLIASGPRGIEFLLGSSYHHVRYLGRTTAKTSLSVDGTQINVRTHTDLDGIVYKNSGGASDATSDSSLLSQIPGKVVSLVVAQGDAVKRGDPVAILESMKMQVTVKSHADGTIQSLKVGVGDSVAKGDVIAELDI